jgi:transcriptional regulator with XRE-family HTH domain
MSATPEGRVSDDTVNDCNAALGRTLVLLRELKGISMREHAKQLSVSPATLCRIEDGRGCDLATLVKIHKATGVKLHTLLGEKP